MRSSKLFAVVLSIGALSAFGQTIEITAGGAGQPNCTGCALTANPGIGANNAAPTFQGAREAKVGFSRSPGGLQSPVPRTNTKIVDLKGFVPNVMGGSMPPNASVTPPGAPAAADVKIKAAAEGRKFLGQVMCGADCGQAQPPSVAAPSVPVPTGQGTTPLLVPNTEHALKASDPVNPFNGEFVHSVADIWFPGWIPYNHVRTYRSRVRFEDTLGQGWDHTYNQKIVFGSTSPACATRELWYSNGRAESVFFKQTSKTATGEVYFAAPALWPQVTTTRDAAGNVSSFTMKDEDGMVHLFDAKGLLTTIKDPYGHQLTVVWKPYSTTDPRPVVSIVTDSEGRIFDYAYYTSEHPYRLFDVLQRGKLIESHYTFTATGQLESSKGADDRVEKYVYAGQQTSVIDYITEPNLVATCQAACAPASQSCQSQGKCEGITANINCSQQCAGLKATEEAICNNDCAPKCATACGSTCVAQCATPAAQTKITNLCNDLWTNMGQERCSDTSCRESCGDTCKWDCTSALNCMWEGALENGACSGTASECAIAGAAKKCFSMYGDKTWGFLLQDFGDLGQVLLAAIWDGIRCVGSWLPDWLVGDIDCNANHIVDQWHDLCNNNCASCCWKGNDCGQIVSDIPGGPSRASCNAGKSCADDCTSTFFTGKNSCSNNPSQGCTAVATAECVERCACDRVLYDHGNVSDFSKYESCKNSSCGSACTAQCIATCTPAAMAAKYPNCVSSCQTGTTAAACTDSCVTSCVDQSHANGAVVGPKYGYRQDVTGNLIEIEDGYGVALLRNTYGQELGLPSFDAVIEQTIGLVGMTGGTVTYKYAALDTSIGVDADFTTQMNFMASDFCTDDGMGMVVNTVGGFATKMLKPVRATKVTDAYGAKWTYYFNANGQVIRVINQGKSDTISRTTSFEYDEQGRQTGVQFPMGDRTCVVYDDALSPGTTPSITIKRHPVPGEAPMSGNIFRSVRYELTKTVPRRLTGVSSNGEDIERNTWDSLGRQLTHKAGSTTQTFVPGPDGLPVEINDEATTKTLIEYSHGTAVKVTTDAPGSATDSPPSVTVTLLDDNFRPSSKITPLGAQFNEGWVPGRVGQLASVNIYSDDSSDNPMLGKVATKKEARFTYDQGQVASITWGGYTNIPGNSPAFKTTRVRQYHFDSKGSPGWTADWPQGLGANEQRDCTLYGPGDRLLEVVRPEGDRTRYSYDGEGRLLSTQVGSFPADPRVWDDNCNANANGSRSAATVTASSTEYDLNGRPSKMIDGDGRITKISYAGYSEPAIIERPEGEVIHNGYDALGRLSWRASYRGTGAAYTRPSTVSDLLMSMADYTWRAFDVFTISRWNFENTPSTQPGVAKLIANRKPRPADRVETYHQAGSLYASVDVNGATTARYWDGSGRLLSVVAPNSAFETYKYLDGGRTVKHTWSSPAEGMRNGSKTRTETTKLSQLGQPLSSEYSNPTPTAGFSGPSNMIEPSMLLTKSFLYNGLGQLESITANNGLQTSFGYDWAGRRVEMNQKSTKTNQNLNTTWGYDRNGLLIRTASNAESIVEAITYDAVGRRTGVSSTDGTGTVVSYAYLPGKMSLQQVTGPTTLTTYTYSSVTGLPVSIKSQPKAGYEWDTWSADQWGNPRNFQRSVIEKTYAFDAKGRPVSGTVSNTGIQSFLAYDSMGQLVFDANAFGFTVNTYDAVGNKTRSLLGGTVGNNMEVLRTFDALGRLRTASGNNASTELIYDAPGVVSTGGPLKRIDTLGPTTNFPYFPMQVEYVRDAFDLVRKIDTYNAGRTSVTAPIGKMFVSSQAWSLGSDDGLPRSDSTQGGPAPDQHLFTYDAFARVTMEGFNPTYPFDGYYKAPLQGMLDLQPIKNEDIYNGSVDAPYKTRRDRFFTWDTTHNITKIINNNTGGSGDVAVNSVLSSNGQNRYISFPQQRGSGEASYVLAREVTYSSDLSIRSFDNFWHLVDSDGYTALAAHAQGVAGGKDEVLFDHDAFGRLVRVRQALGSQAERASYSYDGQAVAIENRASAMASPTAHTEVFVAGNGPDEYLFQFGTNNAIEGAGYLDQNSMVTFFHQDRQGNVVDTYGFHSLHFLYGAMGERTPIDRGYPASFPNYLSSFRSELNYLPLIGYRGRPHFKLGGGQLVDMRERMYRPDLGRFTSRDPIGFAGGTNVYAYANGAPFKYQDPSGLSPSEAGRTLVIDGTGGPSPFINSGQGTAYDLKANIDRLLTHSPEGLRAMGQLADGMLRSMVDGFGRCMESHTNCDGVSMLPAVGMVGKLPAAALGVARTAAAGAEELQVMGIAAREAAAGLGSVRVGEAAVSEGATEAGWVNLASPESTRHILHSDSLGGGHLWPGAPGKTPFPESWSAEKIMHNVSEIATDPAVQWIRQTGRPGPSLFNRDGATPSRWYMFSEREGVRIKVIVEPAGKGFVTAHPEMK
jgi:RHS repeat-associated protein